MLLQIHWQNQALVTLQLTQPLALLGLGDRPRRSGRNATSNSRLNLNPFSTRLCYVTPPSRSTGPGSLGTGRPPRRRPAAADPAPFSMPYVKEGKIFLNRTMFGIFFSSFAGAVVTFRASGDAHCLESSPQRSTTTWRLVPVLISSFHVDWQL